MKASPPLLALVGDWNAEPDELGRWSPHWLAASTGMVVSSSGPGRHGDIDYAMAAPPRADTHPTRRPPPGSAVGASDHDVYAANLGGLHIVSWNMRYGREPDRAARDLTSIISSQRPDVLALQEAADYHHAIHEVARQLGFVVLASPRPGRWHQVLMVRKALSVDLPRFVQLSPHGWWLVAGGRHRELWATSWLIGGRVRVVDLHLPPSVSWRGGRIRGPVMRVAAYVAAMQKLRRWALRWQRLNTP